MKVLATNLAKATTIRWNNKEIQTGIYKYPVNQPIYLGKTDVTNDKVFDRKHHGGTHKACYLFSHNHYKYWQNLYPNLDWNYGMFGENLTIANMDENSICIGDIYSLGTAIVQISTTREPCYKLGVRFNNQNIIKQYIDYGFPGTYVRILQEGEVTTGDSLTLIEKSKNSLTACQLFKLIMQRKKDQNILKLALNNHAIPEYKREKLKKFLDV